VRLEACAIPVATVDIAELAKAEGGVTCCGLIFSVPSVEYHRRPGRFDHKGHKWYNTLKIPGAVRRLMITINISKMKDTLSEVLNRAAYGRERIVVASRGKPKAAVISIEDLKLLEELEDALAAREAREEYERGETVSLEQLIAELEEGGGGVPD
jgi:prevent-host-death family protein